ncbi:MAG: SLC13 family permease, partial [Muribaculaceae bacterium]|nr:SLC13 family permease [Muribaculaceae bacterium]
MATAFFVWGKIRSDIVALVSLIVLAVGNVITTSEALSGFSNSIVIMMIGLFVVGGAIFNTGLAKMIGAKLLQLAGGNPLKLFIVVIGATSLIGAFVSNTGTVALMLPIVVSMAAGSDIQKSRLLMPLTFASSMGGMLTLIGTPPNLVIAEVWEESGHEPLSFFSFLPAGLICVTAGTLLLIPLSKWFLSRKNESGNNKKSGDGYLDALLKEYGIHSQIYRVSVKSASSLCGKTLMDINLRAEYNLDMLEVRPNANTRGLLKKISQYTVKPDTVFNADDMLYIRGDRNNVERFAKDYRLAIPENDSVSTSDNGKLEFYELGIAEIVMMPNSSLINSTIASIKFRERFGVNVVAVKRKHNYITADLATLTIKS